MNLSTHMIFMDLENRLAVAWGEQEEVGGIGNLGLRDANYCFLEWINNESLLCSTEHYV